MLLKIIFGKLAEALLFLHKHKVLMASLSKHRVFLDQEALLKVDFFDSFVPKNSLPDDEVAGEIAYLAPEMFSSLFLDEKIDSYSFGVLALELITGKLLHSDLSLL